MGRGTDGVTGALSAQMPSQPFDALSAVDALGGVWLALRPASRASGPHRLTTDNDGRLTLRLTNDCHQRRLTTTDLRLTNDDDDWDQASQRPTTATRLVFPLYSPGEEPICKYADQNAIGGGATPPSVQPLVGQIYISSVPPGCNGEHQPQIMSQMVTPHT